MKYQILILVAFGMLTACAHLSADEDAEPQSVDYERIQFAGSVATPGERDMCEAVGGEVRPDGLAGSEQCIQTMPDAGKACTDSSECLAECKVVGEFVDFNVAAVGQCSQNDSPFGCFQTVEDGLATPAICVD